MNRLGKVVATSKVGIKPRNHTFLTEVKKIFVYYESKLNVEGQINSSET